MPQYSLKTILSTFAKANGKKRLLFNKGPVGGLNSTIVTFILYSLPFLSYAIIFGTSVFDKLGIATSIILFIISSSTIMMAVFIVAIRAKKAVLKAVTESWNSYFEGIDLNLVLASTKTPYSDFFKYYEKVKGTQQTEYELHKYLLESFTAMQEDNKELIEAMQRDNRI